MRFAEKIAGEIGIGINNPLSICGPHNAFKAYEVTVVKVRVRGIITADNSNTG